MTIYHVETQQAYDELMIELEEKGCELPYGGKPTEVNLWFMYKETTCLIVDNYIIIHNSLDYYKEKYPNESIIEYKKGAEMEQEKMKQNILEWATDVFVATGLFARDIKFEMKKSTVEADLLEAKSSAKKLIEKIDECLETLKPEFKVGDYVTDTSDDDPFICKIEEFVGNDISGKWYCVSKKYFDKLVILPISDSRLSTKEEIAEYESALQFHNNGRNPFELKRGDIVYLKGYDKNIFLDSGNIYKKHNFVNGDAILVKTAEEVNEWLENK